MLEIEFEDRVGDLPIEASLRAAAGEVVALTGPSGSGKTTILRAIAGLRRPLSGTVRCGDAIWFDSAAGTWLPTEERRVGMVFQDYALFPRMDAAANVAFALADLPRQARPAAVEDALERVGLADRSRHRPSALSGGERQRLALARAIARRPSVLLLDEPLASLDRATAESALDLIEETVASLDLPCLLVTHDLVAIERAARVVAVERGVAREDAPRPT
ncbi:MAG: ATP-binding cassette domain-containing protein [Actinomycetes bacterium]